MKPTEIPQELIDILDDRAGKLHSRNGKVINTLAEILTRYDERVSSAIRTALSELRDGHSGCNTQHVIACPWALVTEEDTLALILLVNQALGVAS